ncbi:MAG: thiol protease/hemagglutinin PrtT [Prevotella sp.]|nr:thiol protease/hemagglutinin PrtT [Prevotella sp.]
MMRKIYLSMLLFMLCVVYAVANPVTQAQALQKARAFLQKRGTATTANLNLVYQGRQVSPQHGAPAKDPCYYVFNNGHNAGFIIMAGDDCAEDVLGYADSGTFDPNDIPDNMQEFLKGYVEEIVSARARNTNNNTNPNVEVELTRKVVAPLIQTHWNQQDPYNQQCPTIGGKRCVTGCVATAFAQVMYYHKWPQGSTNVVPAYSSYEALPSTTFKWDKMKPVYNNTGEDDEDAEAAVAELMHYCGQAVYMSYGTGSSGASPYYIPNALNEYFGYPEDNNPQYVSRSSYTSEQWDELIYTELKYGRPVLYGANTSGEAGHEFICDGYDGHGLFHINWGWGGLSDGYFRLQALRPSNQGTGGSGDYGGYSLNHDAIVGVSGTMIPVNEEPTESVSALRTKLLQVTSDMTIDYSQSNGFNGVNASIHFSLVSTADEGAFDVGIGIYQDGQLLQQKSLFNEYTVQGGRTYKISAQPIFRGLGKNLVDGTYQIVGIYKVYGTEEWLPNIDSDRIYIEVVISNGQATFTNVAIDPPVPVRSIVITNVEQRFDVGTNLSQIRAYITNTGETDYSGSVHLLINNSWVAEEGVYIPIGSNDYVDFFFPKMTGTFTAVVASDKQGSHPLYTGNITLSGSAPALPALTLKNVNIKNLGSGKVYGSMLDGTATFENSTNEDFEGNLTLTVNVFDKQEGGYYYYTPQKQLIPTSIKAGETKTVAFNYTRMTVGDKIMYSLTDPAGNELAASSWFIDVVPAIALWKGNGERTAVEPTTNFTIPEDVCAVSLEDLGKNLGSYQLILNDNPNTIYYVTGSAIGFDNPDAMIVRGGMAENVELDANYDFYFPMSFHANSILYSWIPDKNKGADGKNGWQTITLPFGVQAVTSVGNPIDWYRGNETEDNKDFWVREFKQVEGNVVKFADANDWVANVPYIIAVPGNHWGPQYDLTNKEMQFIAEDVLVERTTVSAVVSDGYEFVGVTGGLNPLNGAEELALSEKFGDVYILNESGNAFVPASIDQVSGKHNIAYFTINDRTIIPPACLNIGTFDNTDGISTPQIRVADGKQVDVYAIDGVKVSTVTNNNGTIDLSHLPKGVYIVEGRKVVRK